ncbi:MAG TPA: bacillithiol biosynthesis cysteine-adding enzyme BshC [Candidatus Acidoferrales bacterium]|nr:bacillithiol biosynthesis cysteine-adding enzyme BshC [Candidatus Acidoferrales bacterium]
MRFDCLPPQQVPHLSRLTRAFLTDFSKVSAYFEHTPTLEGVRTAASLAKSSGAQRSELVSALRAVNQGLGGDSSVARHLDLLAAGAVAVVAGQQTGLFTGPAYTLYKALTAIRLAQELTAQGVQAVPVFWLASEDHDLAEVDHCDWLGRAGLERIELPHDEADEGRPVGEIALGPGVDSALAAALAALDGPGADAIASALRASYAPAESYSSAFGKLLARLFAGRGLILLDPHHPAVASLATPLVVSALRLNPELVSALRDRGRALERSGFHEQVKVTDKATLLFAMVDGRRLPLRVRGSVFQAGSRDFTLDELVALVERNPGALSPSALLRPIVQDALLPTAACVVGPAELAYFAQSEVVYRRLLGRMPAVLPRAGFTLIEPHVARLFRKYGLDVGDVLRGRQHLRRRLERESVPRSLARQMSTGERNLRRYLTRIRKPLRKLDPTLSGALDISERKMLYQLEKLRTRAGRAADRREELLDHHERILCEAIAPHHDMQERTLCALPILARHGLGLLDALADRALAFVGPGGACHHVAFL